MSRGADLRSLSTGGEEAPGLIHIPTIYDRLLERFVYEHVKEETDQHGIDITFDAVSATYEEGRGKGSQINGKVRISPEFSDHFDRNDVSNALRNQGRDLFEEPSGLNQFFSAEAMGEERYLEFLDVVDHEGRHLLQELSDASSVSVDDEWAYLRDHIYRAHSEANAIFAADSDLARQKNQFLGFIENPWQVPNGIRYALEKSGVNHSEKPEIGIFDDPNGLGFIAAAAIREGFIEEYGHEQGTDLASEYLLTCVTSPRGLEGAVDKSLEMRGLPTYIDNVETYIQGLHQHAEDGVASYMENIAEDFDTKFDAISTDKEAMDIHYDAHALETAYQLLDVEGDEPSALTTIRDVQRKTRGGYTDPHNSPDVRRIDPEE